LSGSKASMSAKTRATSRLMMLSLIGGRQAMNLPKVYAVVSTAATGQSMQIISVLLLADPRVVRIRRVWQPAVRPETPGQRLRRRHGSAGRCPVAQSASPRPPGREGSVSCPRVSFGITARTSAGRQGRNRRPEARGRPGRQPDHVCTVPSERRPQRSVLGGTDSLSRARRIRGFTGRSRRRGRGPRNDASDPDPHPPGSSGPSAY
jgi:hypothetical protein